MTTPSDDGPQDGPNDPASDATTTDPARDAPSEFIDHYRAERLERRSSAAKGMLSALQFEPPLDREFGDRRLAAAIVRIYDGAPLLPGGATAIWIVLSALFVVPALLLQWSATDHSPAATALLYMLALVLGGMILGFGFFAYFWVATLEQTDDTPHIWAWIELEEQDRSGERDRPRVGIPAVLAVAAALLVVLWGLRALQHRHGWLVELALLVALTPLMAGILASVIAWARARAQPALAHRPRSAVVGDVTMLNLLNLAYFCARSADAWDDGPTRRRIVDECERTAVAAELEFFQRDGIDRHRDALTTRWAREQSGRLAATLRLLKRPLLLASTAERFDDFTRAVSDALAAAIRGDWQALTSADAPPLTPRRLRQLITVLVPSALLAGASFALPMMLDLDDAAAASARTSLLVAALLALIASVSPESQKATAVIQAIADKAGRGGSS